MKVFLRYIRKNMLEKKGRLFLLIFSIMLSCALMIVSMGLVKTVINSELAPYIKMADGKDVYIRPKGDSFFFKDKDINKKGIKDLEGELDMTGIIDSEDDLVYVTLRGKKTFDKNMIEGNFKGTSANDCVISKRIADENKLKVGDKYKVTIGGEEKTFNISGIAATDGVFYNDSITAYTVVIRYDYLNDLLDADGSYNLMSASFDDDKLSDKDRESNVKEFNDANKKVFAEDIQYVDMAGTETIQMPLYVMLGIVCVICALIISGVFRLVITERIQTIGTFMSQGATKKKIQHMLLFESFIYAVIACILGSGVGIGINAIITRLISPNAKYGIYNELEINPIHIVIGCAFAIVLSLISAWLPIRKVKKLQVKEVILNRVETHEKTGIITRFFTGIGVKIFRNNPTIFIAINNIKTSKLLRSNIRLITISLAAVLSIVSTSKSMMDVVAGAYEGMEYSYDIGNILESGTDKTTTDSILNELENDNNVKNKSINPVYSEFGKMEDQSLNIYGVKPEAFGRYLDDYVHFSEGDLANDYKNFINSKEKDVVISAAFAKTLDKKVGDKVTLTANEKDVEFRVVAIADFNLYNSGMVCLINEDYAKSEFGIREASFITIETKKDGDAVKSKLKKMTKKYGATIMSVDEEKQENIEGNDMVMKVLSVFAYIAMGVAAIGIFNNITICFMQRKREFAVMTSLGMNKNKRRNLILTENLICAICSILIAVPLGKIFNEGIELLLGTMNLKFDVYYDLRGIIMYGILVMGIVIVASVSALSKSKKISVITELKYE